MNRNPRFDNLGGHFILSMAMCIPAFAVDKPLTSDSLGSITVKELEKGVTVEAYRIITVNMKEGKPANPVYIWVESVATWLSRQNNYKTYVDSNDNAVTDKYQKLHSDLNKTEVNTSEIKKFSQALELAIKNNDISEIAPSGSGEVTENSGEVTIDNLPMGQYLLIVKPNADPSEQDIKNTKIYTSTTVNLVPTYNSEKEVWELSTAFVIMKGQTPTITKTILETNDNNNEDKKENVGVGEIITYELEVLVPSYPENTVNGSKLLEVGDKFGKGLAYVNDNTVKVKLDGTEIPAVSEDSDGNETRNYTLYSGNDVNVNGYTFRLVFSEEFLSNTSYTGKIIKINYDAEVTTDAIEVDAIKNTASMKYSRDPYSTNDFITISTEKKVYTYGIEINKKDADVKVDENEYQSLSGVEFKLYKDKTEGSALKFINSKDTSNVNIPGKYTFVKQSDTVEEVYNLAVNENGKLVLQGLDAGTYYLEETKAPDGYILPKGRIEIIITDNNTNDTDDGKPDGKIDANVNVVSTEGTTAKIENVDFNKNAEENIIGDKIVFDVLNSKKGFDLPLTGGMGTIMFTIVGITLMAGAVVVFHINKKKKVNE